MEQKIEKLSEKLEQMSEKLEKLETEVKNLCEAINAMARKQRMESFMRKK